MPARTRSRLSPTVLSGSPHDIEVGKAAAEMDLDIDRDHVDPLKRHRIDARDHEIPPTTHLEGIDCMVFRFLAPRWYGGPRIKPRVGIAES